MRKVIGLVMMVCACAVYAAQAQVVSTLPDIERTEQSLFLYEVKLIDEFAERFNDEADSYLRRQSKRLVGTDSFITRHRLIRSLFDGQQQWGADTGRFITDVLNKEHPAFVSLTDSNFYVSVMCTFETNRIKYKLPIVLQMRAVQDAHCWMIAGVGQSAATDTVQLRAGKQQDTRARDNFIPTTAHGSGFATLRSLLSPEMYTPGLFTPQALGDAQVQRLITLINSGRTHFLHAGNMMFHYYGIDGWAFTVSRAKRNHTNSGWLISNLTAVTKAEKEELRHRLLQNGQ